jgi:hypothetical protein
MSIMPGKNPFEPEGLYGAAKKGVPGFLADLGAHIFGKDISHIPGALPGQRALAPKSRIGKAVVKKIYGDTSSAVIMGKSGTKYPIISKPRRK